MPPPSQSPFTFEEERSLWRLRVLVEWVVAGAVVGALCGGASALFLWLLELVTDWRGAHEQIVWALPVAGLVIGTLYARVGGRVMAGTNLVIDTIHDGGPEIPLRMAPLVLVGTVLTHLFGGSAGREGTAVQMGASLADFASHRARLRPELRRVLVAAGVAGGFGSVFGTPIAGAVFGMELVVIGRLEYGAIVPALTAALVGDQVVRALGIHHSSYPVVDHLALTPTIVGAWVVVGIAIAATARTFVGLAHGLKAFGAARVTHLGLRMACGGLAVVGLWQLVGTSEYLGIGVPTILAAFTTKLATLTFAWKLVFTTVTVGAGFLGGEVTPLFFIGAALGSVLAPALGLPRDLGAGCGMAAMFAAAANTPLALTMMAIELLGANVLPHVAIVVVVAYVLAGRNGIYPAQRAGIDKLPKPATAPRVANHHAGAELRRDAPEGARN